MSLFYQLPTPADSVVIMGCVPLLQTVPLNANHNGLLAGTLIYKDADNKYVQVTAGTQISCEHDVRIIAESVQGGAVDAAAYAKGWFLASRLVCPIDLNLHADILAKMDIVLM